MHFAGGEGVEVQGRFIVCREGDLGLFDLMCQPVTGAVFDQGDQAFRLQRINIEPLLVRPDLPGVGASPGR